MTVPVGVESRWRRLLYRLYARRLEADVRRRAAPQHVGIILDGNRRWARAQGRAPVDAYRVGAAKLDEVLAWCVDLGIPAVTLWACSTENLARAPEELRGLLSVIENKLNVGFGRANNQALPHARGRYLLLLNTDAFVAPDTLQKTIEYMDAHPSCGVLGVKLVGRDGALQPSCRYFPTPLNVFLTTTGLKRFFPRTRLVDNMSWDHASVRECD